jgi:hypothetical protein
MVDRNAPDWEPELETAVAGPPSLARPTSSKVSELFSSEKYEVPKHVARRALNTMEGNDPYKLGATIFRIALDANDLPELSTPTRNFRWRQRIVRNQPPAPPPPPSRATNAERTKVFNAVYAAQQIVRQLEQKMETVKERIRSMENEESILGERLQEKQDLARARLEEAERVHTEHLLREEALSRARLEEAERAQRERIHHEEEQVRTRLANMEPELKERSKQLNLTETMLMAKLEALHDGKACPNILGAVEALYVIEKAHELRKKGDYVGIVRLLTDVTDAEGHMHGCRSAWEMIRPTRETSCADANKKHEVALVAAGCLEAVIQCMQSHPEHVGVQAEGCFALMCLAVQRAHKVRMAEAGGIAVILAAMPQHTDSMEVQEYGCRALGNMAWNDANKRIIAEKGGIEAAFRAMTYHSHHEGVQRWGCYMMYFMVDLASARPAIREGKAVMNAARNNFPNNDQIKTYLDEVYDRIYCTVPTPAQ